MEYAVVLPHGEKGSNKSGGSRRIHMDFLPRFSFRTTPHWRFALSNHHTSTMKLSVIATTITTILHVAAAAPAIVWRNGPSSSGPSYTSDPIHARSLLSSVSEGGDSSSAVTAVVFVVGRNADGSEGLRTLAASGSLPLVQERYGSAESVHYQVSGVESARILAQHARRNFDGKVVEVTLEEYNRKLSSIAPNTADGLEGKVPKSEQKRRRDIAEADVLIVRVLPTDSGIDSSISAAIDSSSIGSVLLSSVRSIDEVKHARTLAVVDKLTKVNSSSPRSSRRLEDEANNENGNNANGQDVNMDGVYYVNMTPNIFAGLLFFFLFAFTAHLGLSCMNMIEGQDVYVKKMPHIGREV